MFEISVCIVTYQADPEALAKVLESLGRALDVLQSERGVSPTVLVVDNSPTFELGELETRFAGRVRFQVGQGNVGFGRGHNLCLEDVKALHLVLNPDVEIEERALVVAYDFMVEHPECVLLSPHAEWEGGARQYLCKGYPSVLDLGLRGFAPRWMKACMKARLDRYEMRGVTETEVSWAPTIVSGCFMLWRGDTFRRLGGFDPGYFLYFEDFDISLRARRLGRIAYVPAVRIIHHGGHAARKGWRHVMMFVRSGWRFFGRHGWRLR